MSGMEGARIFVGGLSRKTTELDLEAAFSRFGKVLDAQIMVERNSGRPRGFGFVTFFDKRAMHASIRKMHNKELGGRQISVNKAEPKVGSDDAGSGDRGSYRGGADDPPPVGRGVCFKYGRQGHWTRDCPSAGGDGGRYGDRYRLEGKDSRYNGGRDRYPTVGDRLSGYRKERSFDRYGSGGPARYRERLGPYDRPSRGMALPGAAQPSPQVVGAAFVQQYYVVLHQSPDQVHRFYQDSSILSRPDSNGVMTSVTTMQAIQNTDFSLDFSNCSVWIDLVDSQASYNDGVLVVVTGSLTGRDNNISRNFTQSFFLAPQESGGYVVLNDILIFADLGQLREANQVIVNDPEPDFDDNDEVVNPIENVASAGENAISADPEIHLGHSDHQLISEATASVSQEDEPKKSYASIVKVYKGSHSGVPISKPKDALPKAAPLKQDQINPENQPGPSSKPSSISEAQVTASDKVPENNSGDVEGHSIYIRNLPLSTTPDQVEEEFKKYGPIKPGGVQVRNHKVERFCFGFVEFESLNSMQAAIKASPISIGGRQAFVEEKRTTTRVVNGVVTNSGNGGARGRYQAGRGNYRNDNFRPRGGFGGNQGYGFGYGRTEYRSRGEYPGRGRGGGPGLGRPVNSYQQRPFQNWNGRFFRPNTENQTAVSA